MRRFDCGAEASDCSWNDEFRIEQPARTTAARDHSRCCAKAKRACESNGRRIDGADSACDTKVRCCRDESVVGRV